ncbi:hypothetical protein EZS27_044062, partial [termite gut metagenome]
VSYSIQLSYATPCFNGYKCMFFFRKDKIKLLFFLSFGDIPKIQWELSIIAIQIVTEPVMGRNTMFNDCPAMFMSRVPFIPIPFIHGEFRMKLVHIIISVSFCQNGSGSNGKVFAVPFYDVGMRNVGILLKMIRNYSF